MAPKKTSFYVHRYFPWLKFYVGQKVDPFMKYMGQNNSKNDLTSVVTANFGGNCDVFLVLHLHSFC